MTKRAEQEFAAPVLHGRRFRTHAIPVDVLKELEAYERLILEVAKTLFLRRNPERQRVPGGFEERLKLSIRTVEPGSAMPILLREAAPPQQPSLLPSSPDEFEDARDIISAAVKAAADGSPLPSSFPRSALGRFNAFGRSLLPDEAIELRKRRGEPGPRYNQTLRKKLVLMEERSFSDRVEVEGRVYEANVEKGHFHVLVGEQRVPGSFGAQHEEVILLALQGHQRTLARIVGTGRYDAQERLERIDELDDVSLVDPEEVTVASLDARVDELRELQQGWLDGTSGEPLDRDALLELGRLLIHLHEQEDLPLPYLYPTPDGGIEAEWALGAWEVSATLSLPSLEAELDAVDTETGAGRQLTTRVDTPDGRRELVGFVTSFGRRGRP